MMRVLLAQRFRIVPVACQLTIHRVLSVPTLRPLPGSGLGIFLLNARLFLKIARILGIYFP
jgi:hypothetical protein